MTYTEHQQVAQIEQTCDEVRKENEQLKTDILFLIHDMETILRLNSLGKTKEIADLIKLTLK